MISSPCVKACQMDERGVYCLGCKRHIGEITKWSTYSESERQKVMAELPRRDIDPEDLY